MSDRGQSNGTANHKRPGIAIAPPKNHRACAMSLRRTRSCRRRCPRCASVERTALPSTEKRVWPPLLDRYHPDFVVMLFGPNDAGDHRSRDHLYLYATASWRRHMTRQLDDAIATLEQGGAHVGIVLNPKFILTTGVGPLNDVYASAARRSKRPTFDLGLIVNQNTREYRYDGFHYTQAGADATGGELVGWIGRIRHGTG